MIMISDKLSMRKQESLPVKLPNKEEDHHLDTGKLQLLPKLPASLNLRNSSQSRKKETKTSVQMKFDQTSTKLSKLTLTQFHFKDRINNQRIATSHTLVFRNCTKTSPIQQQMLSIDLLVTTLIHNQMLDNQCQILLPDITTEKVISYINLYEKQNESVR